MLKGTIVIPVLNEAASIAGSLQRLRARVGSHWQIVVVDGGSSDDTATLATLFCDRLLQSAPGRGQQMNAGARFAQGDILLFLHADTCLPADFAARMAAFSTSGKLWGRFDVQLDGREFWFRIIERMMNLRSRLTGIATGDQALFMTPALFRQCDGYQEIPLMEDVDFCARARKLGRPFCIESPVVTSARKWQRNGIVKTMLLMWWLRFAFFIGVSPVRLHRWYYPCPR